MLVTVCVVDEKGAGTTEVRVPGGSALSDALKAAGVRAAPGSAVRLWGEKAGPESRLSEGDRIELCAPLLVDPREARRARAEKQGDVRFLTCGRHGGRRGAQVS